MSSFLGGLKGYYTNVTALASSFLSFTVPPPAIPGLSGFSELDTQGDIKTVPCSDSIVSHDQEEEVNAQLLVQDTMSLKTLGTHAGSQSGSGWDDQENHTTTLQDTIVFDARSLIPRTHEERSAPGVSPTASASSLASAPVQEQIGDIGNPPPCESGNMGSPTSNSDHRTRSAESILPLRLECVHMEHKKRTCRYENADFARKRKHTVQLSKLNSGCSDLVRNLERRRLGMPVSGVKADPWVSFPNAWIPRVERLSPSWRTAKTTKYKLDTAYGLPPVTGCIVDAPALDRKQKRNLRRKYRRAIADARMA